MREYRHLTPAALLPALLFMACLSFTGCKVYTINKSDLESRLKPNNGQAGLNLNSLYKKQYRNNIDTLICADDIGQMKTRRFNRDSKIRIYTKKNKAIKFYVKTLYIYKDEYLIGERTSPKLYGPNYFPVKLSEISRIEVSGY